MFRYGGVLKEGLCWSYWGILILAVVAQTRDAHHRQSRQVVTTPCPSNDLPELSKSRMCKCLHRPDYQDPSTTNFTPIPPDIYLLDKVPFDYASFGPSLFPSTANTVCVYFGHGGTSVPATHTTPEFVVQAINEHGWPTGTWSLTEFKTMCAAPSRLARIRIGNVTLFEPRECYRRDHDWGHDEGWYTEASKNKHPQLLHFHNPLHTEYGVTALLHVETDVSRRPKKLRFVAEAPYEDTAITSKVQMIRMESPTYDVQYMPGDIITLVPSATDISLNLDFAYQVRTEKQPPPYDNCLEPPQPPPPIPTYDENTCACFLEPRRPRAQIVPGEPPLTHLRLNLSSQIEEYDGNPSIDREIIDFYNKYDHSYIYHPRVPGMEHLLVILYTFLPVYKDRRFREREVSIGDFRYDTGKPVGWFIDPYKPGEEKIYNDACDEAVKSRGIPDMRWTRPLLGPVGNCVPYSSDTRPCYFHFQSDYFFVECVETCDKPKYVCAVWKYNDTNGTTPVPFEFQFVSNSIYYENTDQSNGTFQLPTPTGGSPGCVPTTSVPGLKEWNLLETHLSNKAYHKRSDVWLYNPHISTKFKYVDTSHYSSLTILDKYYVDLVANETSDNDPNFCVEPATYFLETKDNNLCLCTFWGNNVDTWQTHYGRTTSCTHGAKTKPFKDHFKIDFHSRLVDNVKLRVFADTTAFPNLLEDYFVLHAVYIQAMDQYGIPVGKFEMGHWVDINDKSDVRCPHDQFPSQNNEYETRFPIFELRHCHNPGRGNWDLILPNHPAKPTATGNIFMYQNRWKDDFPIVCAQFSIKKSDHPQATRIQFLAFIRVEDKFDDGHAYMVEIRSETLDINDLAKGAPTPFPSGVFEDTSVSYPPINYHYYKQILSPNKIHWQREKDYCLPAVRDPPRMYRVCRAYITTPYIELFQNTEDRPDLDDQIDVYNHLCGQWITAYQKFGPAHPFTFELGKKLNESKQLRDESIEIKKCFSLQAFRTRRKNAWHVRFRVNVNISRCAMYGAPYLKEAAMVAYNQEGFPTGRPGGTIEYGGSFELYNHFATQNNKKHEHCVDDDIRLTLDDLVDSEKMAFHSHKALCMWELWVPPANGTTSSNSPYATPGDQFHQDMASPPLTYIPSMMIWANFKKVHHGFCAIWFFPKITMTGVSPPTHIQFTMEIQINQKGVNPAVPGPVHKIFTIRSPKYNFSYDSSMVKVSDPVNTAFPDLIAEATHPQNLDPSISTSCHDEELPIETKGRPSDECVCELRPVPPTGPAPPPPPGQKPLCTIKYSYYNHIYDSRLYRHCLTSYYERNSPDNLRDDDCRTKLEYPRPPEVFPNEAITLEGIDETEYNNTVLLEPFDPTDEAYYGCGLIKKCVSRFSSDSVENACIQDRSCGMIVTFGKGLGESHHPHDEVTMEIFAVARGWAAVGISPEDEKMGEDYVIECTKEGGEVNMYNSWNIKSNQKNKAPRGNLRMRGEQGLKDPRKAIIRPVKAVFYQDKLYCKYYIKKKFSKKDPDLHETHEYDLDNLYHYIMAFSHALTDPYGEEEGNLRIHLLNGGVSEQGKLKIAGGERLSPLPHETRKFRLHALFMLVAYMFFITLSIFVARYFKETLVDTKICKLDFWYFSHIVTGGLALLSLAIGVMFQLSARAGWRSMFRSNFHTYSGIVAFCLFVAEIIVGLIMKRHLEGKRPLINWVHAVMGHFAYNLALFNMAFADRVAYGFLACNFKTYIFIWMTVYYIIHAFMSYHNCWVDYMLGRNNPTRKYGVFDVVTQAPHISTEVAGADSSRFSLRKSRKLADLEAQRQSLTKKEEVKVVEAPGKLIRMVALVGFTVITCMYTFWAIRKIVHYPLHCYDFYELKDLEENGFN